MNNSLDISVGIIFFNRPEPLKKTYEIVRQSRPARLFLIQDGERSNHPTDRDNIIKCREVFSNIDWDCEVHTNYSDTNLGCGKRPYTGITWMFSLTDKAVILEDDCVIGDNFLLFCKEMLDRYENDLRIGIISAWNHFGYYDFGGYSYGFTKSVGCGAWATWKNRWNKYDMTIDGLNEYTEKCLLRDITPLYAAKKKLARWKKARIELKTNDKISYWDHQWGFVRNVNSWLTIVPKYNQMCNIGISEDATHSSSSKLPGRIRRLFYMETPLLESPFRHPPFVIADREYDEKYYKLIYPSKFRILISKLSGFFK